MTKPVERANHVYKIPIAPQDNAVKMRNVPIVGRMQIAPQGSTVKLDDATCQNAKTVVTAKTAKSAATVAAKHATKTPIAEQLRFAKKANVYVANANKMLIAPMGRSVACNDVVPVYKTATVVLVPFVTHKHTDVAVDVAMIKRVQTTKSAFPNKTAVVVCKTTIV